MIRADQRRLLDQAAVAFASAVSAGCLDRAEEWARIAFAIAESTGEPGWIDPRAGEARA